MNYYLEIKSYGHTSIYVTVTPGMEDYTEPLFDGSDTVGDSFVEGQAN